MDRWTGRVALVTGASAGIGAELVRCLVKHGMKVVGCARNVEKVQKIGEELSSAKGSLKAVKCDLTKEADILKMFQEIKEDKNFGGVDVCINNAGLSHNAPLLSGQTEDLRDMLETNVLATAICVRESYQSMVERGIDDGHIIYMNSIAGHVILNQANLHFYTATKHAVTAIVEGTRQELREKKSHIRVTSISPGVVITEFATRMYKDPERGQVSYKRFECLTAQNIVDAVLYALQSPPHVEVNEIIIRPTEQPV